MCTVSYIPTKDGFYLTSNRDENPLRETLPPKSVDINAGVTLIAPIDKEKGGSWIATDSISRAACLLNGGFEKHKRKLPYAKSRGYMVFDAFKYTNFQTFIEDVNLENIEPFTLILIDDFLQVLVWDGNKKHIQFLSKTIPHLWSSATLYDEDTHNKKLAVFNVFLKNNTISSEAILTLHGVKSDTEFVLNFPEVKTVSTTQILKKGENTEMTYYQKKNIDKDEYKVINIC